MNTEEEEDAAYEEELRAKIFPSEDKKKLLDNLVEGNLFHRELRKHFSEDEMKDTLYCVRMWFGSGLNFFKWKLLREDVLLHSSEKSFISASLPFTRYRHILVFDPSIVRYHVLVEIDRLCRQRNIYPFPLKLSRFVPKYQHDFSIAKDRLQCLFAYYLNHVAFFDFDVRLRRPIHEMLEGCCCMVSTYNNTNSFHPANLGQIYTDAFVNIRFNNDDATTRLEDVNLKFNLYNCDSLVKSGVIKPINNYVTRCISSSSSNVARCLFFNTERHYLLREKLKDKFPGIDYTALGDTQRTWLYTLVDANLFYRYAIKNPQHSNTIFKETEMRNTMYCIRMWFGSDLNTFEWKLLQKDVFLNSSSSYSIPSWLPFKRYVHVLVFDSSLVTGETATNIWETCNKLGIRPLDIDLYRVIPFLLETNGNVSSMRESLARAKDRLLCLFAFHVNHVAIFDLDVRLKMPIHQMLVKSRDLYRKCKNAKHISEKSINSCLFSTKNNSSCLDDVLLDAFVNARLNCKDIKLAAELEDRDSLFNLMPTRVKVYLDSPCGVNAINDYVARCPVNTPRSEMPNMLF